MNRARRKLAVATWTRPTEGLILGPTPARGGALAAFAAAGVIVLPAGVPPPGGRAPPRAEGLNGRLVVGRFVPHRGADLAVRAPEAGGMRTRLLRGVDRLSPAGVAEARTSAPSVDLPAWILALPAFVARPLLALLGFVTGGLGRSALGVPAHPHGGAMLTVVQGAHLDEAWAPPPPFAAPSVHVLVLPVREEPVAIDGQVVVRRQLTLCATVDHRFLDGFEGGALATLLRELLADPERMG